MNYCFKCQSLYNAPGTCNCYAPNQGAVKITPQPYIPGTTWVPYIPTPSTTLTWTEAGVNATATIAPVRFVYANLSS